MVLSEAKNVFKDALTLHRMGRFEEALASYDKVIALMPDNAEVYSNRGTVLQGLRRFAEALASYDKAVALMPGYADAHNNRGNALQDLQRFEEAVASYDKAIALRPDHANARNNRGNALVALRRFEDALASHDAAIAVKPGYAEAHNSRGGVLRELKRPEEARASYEKAVTLRPDYAGAWNSLGLVQYEMKQFEEALASYGKAVAVRPVYAEAFNNRGLVLWELNRLAEALASYDAAISLRPEYAEAYHNRAAALFELKRLDEALASCDAAVALKPDLASAINFRGAIKLLLGRFAEGWADHHWRWRTKNFAGTKPALAAPEWRGEDLNGRSIFVNMEQGLGDTMQFGRYLPLLARRGAKVTFFANRKLHRLLRPLCERIEVVDSFEGSRVFDFQCPLMSLPLRFGTDISSIPADIPYLHAEDAFAAKWKDRLGSKGFKIGIFWQASVVGTVGRGRSIPLREFFPLARIKGARLISLQKNFGLDQLDEVPPDIEIESLGDGFDSGPDAFLDTAAVISQLDLVISADTSIAHLAGALGRPVWVALKYVPDWRWLLDREDSPWYPTARLFRQERAGDWTGVFSRMEVELTSMMGGKGATRKKASGPAKPPPSPEAVRLFEEALTLHRARRFAEALAIYDKAIALMPDNAVVYSNRGIVLQGLRRFAEALASYDKAIALNPGYADAHSNRGNALQDLKRFEEAVASYDEAIALKPDHANARNNRGNALSALKRFEMALASYDAAIAVKPDYAEAFNNRGSVLRELKRPEEALASYDAAIALRPDHADAHNNRGNALKELKRLEAAIASYDAAIGIKPDYAEAFNNRGNVLQDLKRFEEALASYGKAIALKPDHADAFSNRGNALQALRRFEEALTSCDRALALNSRHIDAYCNRGNVLQELKRFDDSIASYNRALALNPDHADVLNNRGNANLELKRFDEAIADYENSIALRPGLADAFKNKGLANLLLGRFAEGWADHEWRWKAKDAASKQPQLQAKEWRGEDLKGRSIFVYMEQGLGDTMQFARYLPLLVKRGAKVTISASPKVFRLLRPLCEGIEVTESIPRLQTFDFHCALMSLPLHFRTDLSSIPADIPYLYAEDGLAAQWKDRLGSDGFKIGIVWQGNPSGVVDRGRSMPLREFFLLARIDGVRLISLQKNHGLDQLGEVPPDIEIETLGDDFDSGPDAFIDTAAVMANLDLVISSDTSTAHLAGALGLPLWVGLKYVPDWRWLLDREDSPWYPTARIFRQERIGDWSGVFSRMERELPSLVRERGPLPSRTPRPAKPRPESEAMRHFQAALRLNGAGRFVEALASYDAAIAINPGFADAHNNRGDALVALKRLEEALESYDKAIEIKPDGATFNNRGNTLQDLNRYEESVASYDAAIALMPGQADIHNNRGNALLKQKRFEAALESYDAAIARDPSHAEAYNNRGNVLVQLKRFDEALASCEKAVVLRPGYANAHINRGNVLHELNRYEEAVASYDAALAFNSDHASAYSNRGNALRVLRRFEEALASCDAAIRLKPGHAEAHQNRSFVLRDMKRLEEALVSCDTALALKPDFPEASCNRGMLNLLLGRFSEGWPGHELRWAVKDGAGKKPWLMLAAPEWRGEDLKGRRIFVYGEQGFGDIMQFARYLPLLVKRGAKITFAANHKILRLLRPLYEGIEVTDSVPNQQTFDFQCALMSLPLHFRTELSTIPAGIPYLHAETGLAAKWKDRLGRQGFKIGIVWQGSPSGVVDRGRSIPLREFAPLARIKGVRLISLQKNHGLEQIAEVPQGIEVETLGDDFDSGPDAFIDTAAVMANLDLVISSDTSTAHLAGALGRPLWVVLKYVPDWRWLLDREDSPWYPTARLFRQDRAGDWGGVFSRMERELRVLVE